MSRSLTALVLVALLAGCRGRAPAASEAMAAEPEVLRPTAPTPEGWVREEVDGLGAVLRPPAGDPLAGKARMIITETELPLEIPATPEVVAKAMAEWRDLERPGATFQVLDQSWIELGGHRAAVVEAQIVDPRGSLRLRQYCLLGQARQWVLTVETDAETLQRVMPIVQRTVDGITFEGE